MGSVQVGYTGVNELAFALEVRNNAETVVIIAPSVTAGSIGTRVGATAGVTVPLFGQLEGPPNTTVKCRIRFDAIGSSGTADVQSATVIVWPL